MARFYGVLLVNFPALHIMPGDHVDGSTVTGDSMESSQKNTSHRKMSLLEDDICSDFVYGWVCVRPTMQRNVIEVM